MPPVPALSPATPADTVRPPDTAPAPGAARVAGGNASPALDWLAAPPTHPHEMKAACDLRLGPLRLSAGARMTPAAVLASGVCTGLILLGVAAVVRAGRR